MRAGGDETTDGVDRRGGASYCDGDRGSDAVLQPCAEDCGTGVMKVLLAVGLLCALASAQVTVIKAGHLVDVDAGVLLADQTIIIRGGKIEAIGKGLAIPAGAEVIDLSTMTVLPGLIDCHTHLTMQLGGNYYREVATKSAADHAVLAPKFALATLEAGFTTVRDVGAGGYVDVALRNAIDRGDILGPRMVCATLGVGATGGHFDESGLSPFLEIHEPSGIADGPDAIRHLIREEIKHGATVIKMAATA